MRDWFKGSKSSSNSTGFRVRRRLRGFGQIDDSGDGGGGVSVDDGGTGSGGGVIPISTPVQPTPVPIQVSTLAPDCYASDTPETCISRLEQLIANRESYGVNTSSLEVELEKVQQALENQPTIPSTPSSPISVTPVTPPAPPVPVSQVPSLPSGIACGDGIYAPSWAQCPKKTCPDGTQVALGSGCPTPIQNTAPTGSQPVLCSDGKTYAATSAGCPAAMAQASAASAAYQAATSINTNALTQPSPALQTPVQQSTGPNNFGSALTVINQAASNPLFNGTVSQQTVTTNDGGQYSVGDIDSISSSGSFSVGGSNGTAPSNVVQAYQQASQLAKVFLQALITLAGSSNKAQINKSLSSAGVLNPAHVWTIYNTLNSGKAGERIIAAEDAAQIMQAIQQQVSSGISQGLGPIINAVEQKFDSAIATIKKAITSVKQAKPYLAALYKLGITDPQDVSAILQAVASGGPLAGGAAFLKIEAAHGITSINQVVQGGSAVVQMQKEGLTPPQIQDVISTAISKGSEQAEMTAYSHGVGNWMTWFGQALHLNASPALTDQERQQINTLVRQNAQAAAADAKKDYPGFVQALESRIAAETMQENAAPMQGLGAGPLLGDVPPWMKIAFAVGVGFVLYTIVRPMKKR